MKKKIEVTIESKNNLVEVKNDKGKKWCFPFAIPMSEDSSIQGVVADIASAMLTGTIVSHLKNSKSEKLKYTLIVETW